MGWFILGMIKLKWEVCGVGMSKRHTYTHDHLARNFCLTDDTPLSPVTVVYMYSSCSIML